MVNYLTEQTISVPEELASFQADLNTSGGVVSFSGLVRPHNGSGEAVHTLHLQAHPTLTARGIAEVEAQAHAMWPLEAVRIRHRTGDMSPGETIVFVAAASMHRRAAFEAADFLMDYLKTQAVFWKKEVTEIGAGWIEPRLEDHQDFSRWGEVEGGAHARHR